MNQNLKYASYLSAAVAAFALTTAAVAQDRPPPPPAPGAPAQGDWAKHMHARQEHRAAALHDILNIHPDQEAAFHAFTASMAPPPRDHGPMADKVREDRPATTPERLDREVARMAERQKAFMTRVSATKAFYAALTPDQRRTFDALPMLDGHGGERHEGPGGRGPMPGPQL
jgi:Spy/CpxP family protein refolding chaperone